MFKEHCKDMAKKIINIMNILFVLLTFYLALCQEQPINKGLMLSYTKEYLALDLFMKVANMMNNLKWINFHNIIEINDFGSFAILSEVYDIKIRDFKISKEDIGQNTKYLHEERKFSFETQKKVAEYTFDFSWRVTVHDLNILYGTGEVKASIKNLYMSVILPKPGISHFNEELKVDFDFNSIQLDAFGWIEALKEWMRKGFNNSTIKKLNNEISEHKGYVKDYFLKSFGKKEKTLNGVKISYNNTPIDTIEANNRLWISYETEIRGGKILPYILRKEYLIKDLDPKAGLALYLSSEHIPATLIFSHKDAHVDIDLDHDEFRGEIEDFYVAMPELLTRYKGNEKVDIDCTLSLIVGNKPTDAFFKCAFKVSTDTFLLAEIFASAQLIPRATIDTLLFITQIQELNLNKIITTPSTVDITLFLSRFFLSCMKKSKNTMIEAPALKYELDGHNVIQAANDTDNYIAYYKLN